MTFPSDEQIETCLRDVVRSALQSDEEITVKIARTMTESRFNLKPGFLKDSDEWRQRSKEIINAAVEEPLVPSRFEESDSGKNLKRKTEEPDTHSDAGSVASKRVKTSRATKLTKQPSVPSKSDDSDEETPASVTKTKSAKEEDDSSDYSSVLDEPIPKRKRADQSAPKTTTKAPRKKAETGPKTKSLSADEEEIKRLQGWLVKCGMRKLWHRELAPYSTPKEKIKHLKAMLNEAGMTGRFSVDKARQIKESRELADELEAAKEFNEHWGQGGDMDTIANDSDKDTGPQNRSKTAQETKRPARRLPKGLVDFGDSGDDESE